MSKKNSNQKTRQDIKYQRQTENLVKKIEKLGVEENTKFIHAFLKEKRKKVKPAVIYTYCVILRDFTRDVKKPLTEATEEDIGDFFDKLFDKLSPYTYFHRVHGLKHLLKHAYKKKGEKHPEWIDENEIFKPPKNRNSYNHNDLLKKEDIGKMIETADNLRDKVIISLLYELGCRAEEFLALNYESIETDPDGLIVNVPNEKYDTTNTRAIWIQDTVPLLKDYLNQHPKPYPDAPLFIPRTGNKERLSYLALWVLLKKISKKARIKLTKDGKDTKVHPHLFRHSRLTELASILPEQVLKRVANWSPDSDMANVYIKLSGKVIINGLKKASGIKVEEEAEKKKKKKIASVICPKCNEENPANYKYCLYCKNLINEEQKKKEEIIQKLLEILVKNPEIMEKLEKLVEEK